MQKVFAQALLIVFATPGFAEVPIDRFYQLAPPDKASVHSLIEQDNLKNTNKLLFTPICTGQLQSPALITDLHAFFAGYTGTRVVDRGNGHYMLMQKPEFAGTEYLQTMSGVSNQVYFELDFSAAAGAPSILWSAGNFFADNELGATTCQAATIGETNHQQSWKV